MWYETLPAGIIMICLMYTGQISGTIFSNLFFGHPFRRDMNEIWDRSMLARDTRVSGAPWIATGLENIPDGPEDKK